jgi:single-stranded-DNA-specific exonuclease
MNPSIHSKIVGVSFEGRQDIIKTLKLGQKLRLIAEPENPYDPNAIKVMTEDGKQAGYLSREMAEMIAEGIRKGITYDCKVNGVTGEGKNTLGANITIMRENGSN